MVELKPDSEDYGQEDAVARLSSWCFLPLLLRQNCGKHFTCLSPSFPGSWVNPGGVFVVKISDCNLYLQKSTESLYGHRSAVLWITACVLGVRLVVYEFVPCWRNKAEGLERTRVRPFQVPKYFL